MRRLQCAGCNASHLMERADLRAARAVSARPRQPAIRYTTTHQTDIDDKKDEKKKENEQDEKKKEKEHDTKKRRRLVFYPAFETDMVIKLD